MGYIRTIILITVMFSVLLGCGGQTGDKTDVGFIGSMSGKYGDLGQESLKGVILAMDSTGMSKKVRLIIKDDKGDPDTGLRALKDMERSGVRYVIGPNISTVAGNIVPYLKKHNLYMISPTVSASELASKNDNFMRVITPNTPRQLELIARYLINKMKIKDMAVIYDAGNSVYANDVVRHFADAYKSRGGKIRDIRPYTGHGEKSMASLISKDKGNPPQMYYVVASAVDTAMILWQIKKAGYKSKVLIRAWASSDDFFRMAGEAADGAYVFNYYTDTTTKAYQAFNRAYSYRYGEQPTWIGLNGYISGVLLFSSLPRLENGDRFEDSLNASTDTVRALNGLTFDENGDGYLPLSVFVIKKNALERIGAVE